jgi:hypothetical protein
MLSDSVARRVADATEKIAGGVIGEIEASLPGALAGERGQVRAYVRAYRALTGRVLEQIGAVRPDLVAFDDARSAVFAVEIKAGGRAQPARIRWMSAALAQEAMSAPFSEWVGELGSGRGTAVAMVAHLRGALRGTEPLSPPARRRLPDWKLEERNVIDFYRAVTDELARTETPLEQVAAVVGVTMTELGRLFGVRRQAVEQWIARGVPPERQTKLAAVGEIADLLAAKLKRDRIPGVVRRAASAYGERSILDAIAAGDEQLVLDELRDAFDWAAAA